VIYRKLNDVNWFTLLGIHLLPFDAHHRRTGADHIEFTRRSPAQVDDATTVEWAAIYYPNDDCPTIAVICNPDPCTERQCTMGGSKPVWTHHLAAGSPATAVERGAAGFGLRRTDHGSQNGGKK
jgi:hypothetical protein